MTLLANLPQATLRSLALATAVSAGLVLPTLAQAGEADFSGQIALNGTLADRTNEDAEESDSSGVGARGELAAQFAPGEQTRVRIEVDASVFEYREDIRGTRESYGGAIELTQELTDQVELRLRVRRAENLAVLESASADQTSVSARLQWERGDDRVRLEGEYRRREYDTLTGGTGDGYRLAAQYNRQIGPYHWLRLDVRMEDMSSTDDPLRSHNRWAVAAKYSLPVAPLVRVRPWVEYRAWKYDSRIALGDPSLRQRHDSFFAPGIELAYGRDNRGLFAEAGVEYRFRTSNDLRYGGDNVLAAVTLGYRF
jgi:hypothetical protein